MGIFCTKLHHFALEGLY